MKAPVMPEKDVQRVCMDWLNTIPSVHVWRRNVGAFKIDKRFIRFSQAGMADCEGIGPGGIHIEIEFKRVGKEPTANQYGWLWECQERGAVAFWCNSLEMCVKELRSAFLSRPGLEWLTKWEPQ